MPTTWGLTRYQNNYATKNAIVVERLLNSGAVVFGKTNVPRYLSDWQTFNQIYGTTNNPWDVALVPGGSSGGSAAALVAGLTGLEVGSDIGASIRKPSLKRCDQNVKIGRTNLNSSGVVGFPWLI